MDNKIEQIAEQNGMTVEFVTWFFNEKKSACGEHWFLALGAMWEGWKGCSAESTAALATIEKLREITGCPAGAGLQDHLRKLVADRDEALSAERVWENAMMEVCGEDGPASVANEIRALQGLRDMAMQALKAQVEQLAAENLTMLRLLTDISENHVEYFSEGEDGMFAGVPLDYVSEINMYVSRDVNAENPFPATDAYLAGINAEALPANIAEIIDSGDLETICYESERSYAEDFRLAFYNFRQLREGAK